MWKQSSGASKSELGMRPVHHHKEDRCDGHLFITVLAYQAVEVIRKKLKESHRNRWRSLKDILELKRRLTMTVKQKNGKTLYIKKATAPEQALKEVYQKLGISLNPGGIPKMTI